MRGDGVRILIVGAGIAGLAAARTLRGWGGAVEIVERAPAPTTEGTGIYLPGNAVRALDSLGLAAQVAERAVRIERQRVADHRGRLLFDIETADLWNGVGPCQALHRATLHQALVAGAGDVPIRWGQTPRAVTVHDAGVTVEFSGGGSDRYDLVLGADGLHSTVRRLVFDAPAPRPVGQYARRFVVTRPNATPVWSVLLGSELVVSDHPDRRRTDLLLLRRTPRSAAAAARPTGRVRRAGAHPARRTRRSPKRQRHRARRRD